MTLRKLLAAVSVLALSATSANALNITTATPVTPALELTLPGTTPGPFAVPAVFSLNTDSGTYPTGTAMLVTITLPAGVTFSSAATAANLDGVVNPGQLNVTLSSGGAAGSNTVTYLVTSTLAGETGLTYTGPLGLSACPAAGAGIVMTANIDGSGTPVDGGTAASSAVIAPCASALNGTVIPDETFVGSGIPSDTTVALAGGFLQINENGGLATNGPLAIGQLNYAINPAVAITGAGTALSPTDITSIAFNVDFVDASNIAAVTLSTGDAAVITGNTAAFNITANVPLIVDGVADFINVAVTGAAALPTQPVSVSGATVTFNDGVADLVATEAGANGAIDALQRQGQNFGPFDWNGGNPTSTLSVYRGTGFTPSVPVAYTVTMTNSPVNGSYQGMVTPNAEGEVVLTSKGFGAAAVPAYTRGDATINFETINAIDLDRLMIRNGVVSDFGDGSNSNGFTCGGVNTSADADNGCVGPLTE